MSVTLTLMPAANAPVMAGRPAWVAGIFTIRLGRSTIHHSNSASAAVRRLSSARPGSTSIDTRPSRPSVAS
jgi:hypothetical protein